jgi:hypothetical protein
MEQAEPAFTEQKAVMLLHAELSKSNRELGDDAEELRDIYYVALAHWLSRIEVVA